MGGAEHERQQRPGVVGRLLATVRADPAHLPERLAAFVVDYLGPQAAEQAAAPRRSGPAGTAGPDPAERIIERGVRRTVVEGSFLGGPFILLLPVAFVAALLAQLRMVLELAALAGRDPCGDDAAAQILVVQGVHPTVEQAQEALRRAARAGTGAGEKASWAAVVRRQAYLIGLVTPEDPARTSLRKWLGWIGLGVLVLIGTVVPFVWVPACGVMYRRATGELGERALRQFGLALPEAARTGRTRSVLRPGMLLVVLRTVLACLATVGAVLLVLVTGARVAHNAWLTMFLVMIGASAVVVGWRHLRARRRRRRRG
ncbi:hypothetical protein ABT247_06870 [Kitasatospora sp. NPDC001539]|uniref:hypothetical protein n=1 Tax=Kitasatospora sp. NPDC001539 TaxID=3154384 RepID=UPI00331A4754